MLIILKLYILTFNKIFSNIKLVVQHKIKKEININNFKCIFIEKIRFKHYGKHALC